MGLLDRFTQPYAQTDTPLNLRLMLAMNALGTLSGSPTFANQSNNTTPSIMALVSQHQERAAKTKAEEKADRLKMEYAQKLRDAGKFEAANAIESGLVEAGDIIKLDYEAIQKEKDRKANAEDKAADRDSALENELTTLRYKDRLEQEKEARDPNRIFLKSLVPADPNADVATPIDQKRDDKAPPISHVDALTANVRKLFKDPLLTPADAFSISLHAQTSPAAAATEAARIKALREKAEFDPSDIVVINDRPYNKRTGKFIDTGEEVDTGMMFDSKSVEGQALNWLVKAKKLTMEEAANVAAGKVVMDPITHQPMFLKPGELVGAAVAAGMPPPAAAVTEPPVSPDVAPTLEGVPDGVGAGPAAVPPITVAEPAKPATSLVPQIPGRKGVPLTQAAPKAVTEDVRKGMAIAGGLSTSIKAYDRYFDGLKKPMAQLGANLSVRHGDLATEILGQAGRYLFLDTDGKKAADAIGQIAQNYTYALSGQAAPAEETAKNLSLILPAVMDPPEMVEEKKRRIHDYLRTIELRAQAVHEGVVGPNDKFDPENYAELKGISEGSTVPEVARNAGVDQELWDAMTPDEKDDFK